MLENEGNEIENEQLSDVSSEVSSEPQAESQPEQKDLATAPKEVPFHEHPRWKEVMEERNAERQARTQLEQQIAAMQRQMQESLKPKDNRPDFNEVRTKMAERLKGIDPEFQSYMSLLEEQALSSKQELAAFREEQFVNRAVGRFEELNKTNGVPAELHGVYRAQLDAAYREGKIRSLEDLEKTYKSIHEPVSKLIESREKAALDKYTTTKKEAASKPSAQPKGGAANASQSKVSNNPADRRQSLIKEAVQQLRASKAESQLG